MSLFWYSSAVAKALSTKIVSNGKTLHLLCVALKNEDLPSWLLNEVTAAFEPHSPFIKNGNQTLYIRDIPFLAIDGMYPGGHCYNAFEAMIAVPTGG